MKKTIIAGIAILATATFTSCEKFDDGGFISKADTRIIGTWKLDKYIQNGTDETSSLLISNLEESYSDNGDHKRSYTEKDGDIAIDNGTYELTSGQKTIKTSGIGSINDFSSHNNSVSASEYTITRLQNGELWYKYTNGGDTHEFKFVEQ